MEGEGTVDGGGNEEMKRIEWKWGQRGDKAMQASLFLRYIVSFQDLALATQHDVLGSN